jgi:hypothetical protein
VYAREIEPGRRNVLRARYDTLSDMLCARGAARGCEATSATYVALEHGELEMISSPFTDGSPAARGAGVTVQSSIGGVRHEVARARLARCSLLAVHLRQLIPSHTTR